jgi:hypothetical protein
MVLPMRFCQIRRTVSEKYRGLISPYTPLHFKDMMYEIFKERKDKHLELHGERHWQSVAWIRLQLAREVNGCDPLIVLLFSIIHEFDKIV